MNLPQTSRRMLERLLHAQALSPWRAQRQWIGAALVLVTGLGMVAALYLDITSQAAIAGRQIQGLRISIVETELVNADLQSQLAESTSTAAMEQRARELGYERVAQGDLVYLAVPGYTEPEPVILAGAGSMQPSAASMPPDYTESLLEWFGRALEGPGNPAWGSR